MKKSTIAHLPEAVEIAIEALNTAGIDTLLVAMIPGDGGHYYTGIRVLHGTEDDQALLDLAAAVVKDPDTLLDNGHKLATIKRAEAAFNDFMAAVDTAAVDMAEASGDAEPDCSTCEHFGVDCDGDTQVADEPVVVDPPKVLH